MSAVTAQSSPSIDAPAPTSSSSGLLKSTDIPLSSLRGGSPAAPSKASSPNFQGQIWGHPDVQSLHPFMKEEVTSRVESNLGVAARIRAKYSKTNNPSDKAGPVGTESDASMGPPHNTITTSSRPSPPIPATSRPSSDLRTPLNDPVGCASSSSANVVSTSALPTWGIWSNKNAASESSGLQLPNAPKSKASEALFDRISKKARLTFPATRSSSGQDQLRGTSSFSASSISPTNSLFPPSSTYPRPLSAQVSPTSSTFPSTTYARPLFPLIDGRENSLSTRPLSSSDSHCQSLPPISSMTASGYPPHTFSHHSSQPQSSHNPYQHQHQSSQRTRTGSQSSASSSTYQRPHHQQPSNYASAPPHSEAGTSSSGRRSPISPGMNGQQWSERPIPAISAASGSPLHSASGIWKGGDSLSNVGGEEVTDTPVKRGKAGEGKSQAAFVVKLYQMLEDPALGGAIEWKSDTSFIVPDPEYFARVVCPQQFKHSNWQSFVRQLNMYGFSKVSSEWQTRPSNSIPLSPPSQQIADTVGWEFRHPCFLRGQTHLLQQIKRKAVRAADKRAPPSPPAFHPAYPASTLSDEDKKPQQHQSLYQSNGRKRSSCSDGGASLEDLVLAAEDASAGRLPILAPVSSTSNGYPYPDAARYRPSEPLHPPGPAPSASLALAAMQQRLEALEEGLYQSRLEALQNQRDLAQTVLSVMDRHEAEGGSEAMKADLRDLRIQLESKQADWTRRQHELQRTGGEKGAKYFNGARPAAADGGARKGLFGLLNE